MAYSGIQMFKEKLKQLINSNSNPEIIISQRPQFQHLYGRLTSMIQTLIFIDKHHHLYPYEDVVKLNDLKKRFIDAAEEAEYIVDRFLSVAYTWNYGNHHTAKDLPFLNLYDVRRSFKSVTEEVLSMRLDKIRMKDSSQRILNQSAAAAPSSISRSSKKLMDEIVVGLDGDAKMIRDILSEESQMKLDVVSIVGMGGIGKTTLATKVFNDPFVVYHFNVRAWVTVSQTYDKRDVLVQMLESIGAQLDLEKASDSRLCELVHKNLMGKRYLTVIDDIWDIETWDNLKLLFPHDNNGSRILLTSRIIEVAKHASSNGLIHHLGYLNKERSWELLCEKVFHGNEYPKWSIKPGMQIVEYCKGLPLALDVIARVLANEAWSEKLWVETSERTGSYIVDEGNEFMEILGLSYKHLPFHLRECFLYFGGFPEDYKFEVRRLIWLWVAEGFIEEDGNRRLEDIAEGYLVDLIDRNIVIVAARNKSNGCIKACKMHDLMRELCLKIATEERFILQIERQELSSQFSDVITPPYKPVRMFVEKDINIPGLRFLSAQNLRSVLWFTNFTSLSNDIAKCLCSFVLLRVLDLQTCELNDFPKSMEMLVHLRYLVVWNSSVGFPSSICNLWGLQTLIYITEQSSRVVLPRNISDLVNLRHLWSYHPYTQKSTKRILFLPSIEKPMNLQTISGAVLGDEVDNFQKCFPCIKELTCITYSQKHYDFKFLTYLEKLKLTVHDGPKGEPNNHISFPTTMKTLTLVFCHLPWSDMPIIQSLPNLQILKLSYSAFEGSCWNTNEHAFQQLKFLRLEGLNIKKWEVCSTSFPFLKQLEVFYCDDLGEIPLEIGDIPTLELIKIKKCRQSVSESARRIRYKQLDMGHYDLVNIDILEDKLMTFSMPEKVSS